LKFLELRISGQSARLTLGTAERCRGGLKDFVGQCGIIHRTRKDQRSDESRHCRQGLLPPSGDRLGRHETAECFNQGFKTFRNGAPDGSGLPHNIGADSSDKTPVCPITAMLR
jgi:hypothetical protein